MAVQEHLIMLKRGMDAWNIWRNENLTNANLKGAHLTHTNFTLSILDGAELEGADIKNACFVGAKLDQALHMDKTRW